MSPSLKSSPSPRARGGAAADAGRAGERVHKVLARLGCGSRREIEERMRAGRVTVNGVPVQPGAAVAPGDAIAIDGKIYPYESAAPASRVLLYYKPEGEICTRSDPEGRPTIYDRLPQIRGARWVGVGRLDINTAGLILLVTNGELANRLMHPSAGVEREYLVRVQGEVDAPMLARLQAGVALEDGTAAFDQIQEIGGGEGANRWFSVILKEGRNREVRRLWESQGVRVSRLKRVRFGPVNLPRRLRRGHYEELDAAGVAELLRFAGMEHAAQAVTAEESKPRGRTTRADLYKGAAKKSRPGPRTKERAKHETKRPAGKNRRRGQI